MDKLLKFILSGKCHIASRRDLKKIRRNAERAGKNLEAVRELELR